MCLIKVMRNVKTTLTDADMVDQRAVLQNKSDQKKD